MKSAPTNATDHTALTAPVLAMASALEPLALAELERALRLALDPPLSAAERRVRELGLLSLLIEEQAGKSRRCLVQRSTYDERRLREVPDAPDSRRLVETYGSWNQACRAARSLRADGRVHGKAAPFSNQMRGRKGIQPYTREEIRAGIRRCAFELGRTPSSGVYQRWSFDVKRSARRAGVELPRVPGINSIYRFYKPWTRAVAAASVTDAEVAHARTTRVLRLSAIDALPAAPLDALRAASPEALAGVGVDPARREHLVKRGLAQVPLAEATRLCQVLGGTLDWLAGIDLNQGDPPRGGVALRSTAIADVLERAAITSGELRRRLELQAGPWRRLQNGAREPMLYELAVLATAANLQIRNLVAKI